MFLSSGMLRVTVLLSILTIAGHSYLSPGDEWSGSAPRPATHTIPGLHPDNPQDELTIGLAQIAPVWLDKAATLQKVIARVNEAQEKSVDLVIFGEALVPGYPFWLELTGGAIFNHPDQKRMFAHYSSQAVNIKDGDLAKLSEVIYKAQVAVYLGVVEKAIDRSGHSLYCSLLYFDKTGTLRSVHRKLMPTYEERLVWAPGDGHGLRVHSLGPFRIGGLNCWENWMPLTRAALYGQGEDLHISTWPGGDHNTSDLPIFLAKEGRSFVAAVSGLLRPSDIPGDTPMFEQILGSTSFFCKRNN